MSEFLGTIPFDNQSTDYVGYHRFASDGEVWGSFEVFSIGDGPEHTSVLMGYYWWPCFPGCLPDSEMVGPFPNAKAAYDDAVRNEELNNE